VKLRDASTLFWLVALALGAYDVSASALGPGARAHIGGLGAGAAGAFGMDEREAPRAGCDRRRSLVAGHVFWFDSPPKVFLQQVSSPLHGLPSLLALIVIALGFVWRLRRETFPRHASSWALVAVGALALLASWLVVLGIGNEAGGGSTSFDWAQGTATMMLAGSGAIAIALGRGRFHRGCGCSVREPLRLRYSSWSPSISTS